MDKLFTLRWNDGQTFTLTEGDAESLVRRWDAHGILSGDLANASGVTFTSDYGGRAVLHAQHEPTK